MPAGSRSPPARWQTDEKLMTRTAHIKTFGCQMNVYDSERMGEALTAAGYTLSEDSRAADLVILNTCHIREKAAEKVYSDIGRLRSERADRLLAVAGCVAQAEGAEMIRRAPEVNLVFGPQSYHRLPELLDKANAQAALGLRPRLVETAFPEEAKFDHLTAARTAAGPSAFVTVQEGCDKFCSFCVVPYTRGAEVSRPVAALVSEVASLVALGVREITLLGQNVNAYHGAHGQGTLTLAGLMRHLVEETGIGRLRYTTSHPHDMSADLIAAHAELPQLMPYIHLPVQAGSDRILKAMNRLHTTRSYLDIVSAVRAARPDIALSGDFIVGFPGETEADFEATLAIVREARYASAYSFKYSSRPGTPAALLADQIDDEVKADRLARLQALLAAQQRAFNEASVGHIYSVLLERPGKLPGQLIGRSPYLQSVHIRDTQARVGESVQARIVRAGANSLEGELLPMASAA
jgi:tRNA-2-methylthio-N6-dimethylallyladenosine synthase